MIGTEGYIAPEVRGFVSEEEDEGADKFKDGDSTYSLAVDIWAVGALVFRMITGQMAFQSPRDLFRHVVAKVPFPVNSSIGPDCHRFLLAAMDASPRRRPTAEQALEEPWIKRHSPKLPTMGHGSLQIVLPELKEQESSIPTASASWSSTVVPASISYRPWPEYV